MKLFRGRRTCAGSVEPLEGVDGEELVGMGIVGGVEGVAVLIGVVVCREESLVSVLRESLSWWVLNEKKLGKDRCGRGASTLGSLLPEDQPRRRVRTAGIVRFVNVKERKKEG